VGYPQLNEPYDVAVIGGGIVGAACCHELASKGLRVCLIEADIIGGGATAAGMGHITAMDDSDAQFALTRYSQLLWKQLARRFGPDAEYVECGAIWVAADDFEMAEVERKFGYYTAHDTPVQVLDGGALEMLEPNLRSGLRGGLLVEEDAVVYPPLAARFLVEQAQLKHAADLQFSTVTRLEGDTAELADGGSVRASTFVIAAGTAAAALVPGVEVIPRKGHLVITDRYPGFVRRQLIELGYLKSAHATQSDSVAFNVQPRPTGQILIGSSRQFGNDNLAVEAGMLAKMLQRAFEYMPALKKCSGVRSWTGFRAATPDKLPLIGPLQTNANVYLATGHEGLGITTALGTAKILAHLLVGSDCGIAVEPYLPSRTCTHA
jgi:glycine/D-amino acid oxidase-like deaminating enzyme